MREPRIRHFLILDRQAVDVGRRLWPALCFPRRRRREVFNGCFGMHNVGMPRGAVRFPGQSFPFGVDCRVDRHVYRLGCSRSYLWKAVFKRKMASGL